MQELIRRIPNGQQVKREVDYMLDTCSETMTPMHYHMREVIFVTYNKVGTSSGAALFETDTIRFLAVWGVKKVAKVSSNNM